MIRVLRYSINLFMDKLYSVSNSKKTPKPSELSLEFIKQYAASYSPLYVFNHYLDTLKN